MHKCDYVWFLKILIVSMCLIDRLFVYFSFQSLQPPQSLARRTLPLSKARPYPPSRPLLQFRQERLHWPPRLRLHQPALRASCRTKRKLTCPPNPPLRSRWKRRGELPSWSYSSPHRSSACRGCSSRCRYDWKGHWITCYCSHKPSKTNKSLLDLTGQTVNLTNSISYKNICPLLLITLGRECVE